MDRKPCSCGYNDDQPPGYLFHGNGDVVDSTGCWRAHRIAAAVYEERERWWIGHGEGCTCHPCVILDRIIAAGEAKP